MTDKFEVYNDEETPGLVFGVDTVNDNVIVGAQLTLESEPDGILVTDEDGLVSATNTLVNPLTFQPTTDAIVFQVKNAAGDSAIKIDTTAGGLLNTSATISVDGKAFFTDIAAMSSDIPFYFYSSAGARIALGNQIGAALTVYNPSDRTRLFISQTLQVALPRT